MNDPTIVPHAERTANLAGLLVSEIRTSRRLRLHLQLARQQRQALADALHAAVATIADLSRKLDRARQASIDLREENRRIVRAKLTDVTHEPGSADVYTEAVQ